jgi:repressor LexA
MNTMATQKRPLTPKQAKVLKYISDYIRSEGYPPTVREISRHIGVASTRATITHLEALEKKGYISRTSGVRSIRILDERYKGSSGEVEMLPLLGTIAAGAPILADENVEAMIPVPKALLKEVKDAYILRVKGDSMVGEGIHPRDLVVVKPQSTAYNGDIVAVLIGDEATVKRIRFDQGGGVTLLSSNPAYEPIRVRRPDARILGKVIALIRDYQGKLV